MPKYDAADHYGLSDNSGSKIEPLEVEKIKNATLERVGIFLNDTQWNGEITRKIQISCWFNSGYTFTMTDKEGKESVHPYMLNYGFMTYSGHAKGRMVPMLKALGFKRFLNKEGNLEGDIDIEFGKNGLNDDYEGMDFGDLPLFVSKGKDKKKDIEVPITRWLINGYSVIGRKCDLGISINNGWNRIDEFIAPDVVEPLVSLNPIILDDYQEQENNEAKKQEEMEEYEYADDKEYDNSKQKLAPAKDNGSKRVRVIARVLQLFDQNPLPEGHQPFFIDGVLGIDAPPLEMLEETQLIQVGKALSSIDKGEKAYADFYTVPPEAEDPFEDLEDFDEELDF